MDVKESIENIEEALLELAEENKTVPIIVEGDKDIDALRKLDVKGKIFSINLGVSLTDFCDMIAMNCREVILLTDWDRKGGYLCHTIRKNLEGRVKCNTRYREIFAKNAMIRTVEGLPSWIKTMKDKI
jgi:5S rRNA maturation endonuclease (ribonuclease M5)